MNEIITLIKDLGFPFAVCVICFWYINKKDKEHTEQIAHLSDSLNNNSSVLTSIQVVIQKLIDKFEG